VKAILTFQPTFSQFCPASPNSSGFGLSQQYDRAIPIAAIRVSTKERRRPQARPLASTHRTGSEHRGRCAWATRGIHQPIRGGMSGSD
jgi:hypothetical protein